MKDILLLNPPMLDTTKWGKALPEAHCAPPIGIASLAAIAAQEGFSVSAADLYFSNEVQVKEVLEADKYRVIGISCFTDQRAASFRLAKLAKETQPGAMVILGGPHPTFMYRQILEHYPVDVVVIGEGELTLIDLLNAVKSGTSLKGIPGLAFCKNGEIIVNPTRPRIKNLDILPAPALHHFQQCKYAHLSWYLDTKIAELSDVPVASIVGSRGCTWNCQFCSTPRAWGRRWYSRSPEKIVSEIQYLYQKYGYRFIDFGDDIFTVNRRWTYDLCKQLANLKLPIKWGCCTRADTVDLQLLEIMVKAGCVDIGLGVESGSQHIRDNINKRLFSQDIYNAFTWAKSVGLVTDMLLMVGNIGETRETIDETLKLIENVQPDIVSADIATIFPGTALYDISLREGIITDEFWLTENPAPYFTLEHSEATLKNWLNEILTKKGGK